MTYHDMVMKLREEILSRIPHKVCPNYDEEVMERLIKMYNTIINWLYNG